MNFQLREALLDDARYLLNWRNEISTRKASLNSEPIDFFSHIKWLENSLINPDRQIYIAEYERAPIGTCRVDYSNMEAELSWTVGEKHRGNNFGVYMLALLIAQTKSNNLVAKIKPDNLVSKKLASKFGFEKVSETDECETWRLEIK